MSNKVAIKYRDFYDVPRIFLTTHEGVHFLFDCKFDDALDEYPNSYRVYILPRLADSDFSGSWDGLPKLAIRYLGEVPVSDVKFDRTLRSEIDAEVIENLAAARQKFIDQGGGTYSGGVRFGLDAEDGPFEAGLNMPRPFVGSFNIIVTEQRNGDAAFVLENATTLKSALYQIPGVQPVERTTMLPLSNKTQTYWWIERGVIKR